MVVKYHTFPPNAIIFDDLFLPSCYINNTYIFYKRWEDYIMQKNDIKYQAYVQILREELIPAMGCTEPIALAYAAAVARDTLGAIPERIEVCASGSIIKNVKSVIVPNTQQLKGIPAAVTAGIIAGNAERELEVIADVSAEQITQMKQYLEKTEISVKPLDSGITFDIVITAYKGDSFSKVRIANYHTNIVHIEKDQEILLDKPISIESEEGLTDRSLLCMESIWDFAQTVDIEDVKSILDPQISCNMAIAEEGIRGNYGANIGSVLLSMGPDLVQTRAKAMAAAASDARMNGCELPVIINSGSGNQGITTSVPVIVYARELNVSDEQLYRALTLSNLTTIHQKTPIGRLSAYCGAVSAACGAGAGITYMYGGTYQQISLTIINTLGNVGGIVCDGAKPSCAAKIASSVDAALMAFQLSIQNKSFLPGEGIIKDDIEETIKSMGYIGRVGMRATDTEILNVMIDRADINQDC